MKLHEVKHALIFSCALLIQLTQLSWSQQGTENILFHSQVNGELKECNCEGQHKGGVARLWHYFEQQKQANPDAIMVSPGNWLSGRRAAPSDSFLLEIIARMGFKAIAVGPYDLAQGIGRLRSGSSIQLPWINCNIGQESGSPVFTGSKVITAPWGKVFFTSAISRERLLENCDSVTAGAIQVMDPVAALRQEFNESPQDAQPVLVSYLTSDDERKLINGYHGERPLLVLRPSLATALDTVVRPANALIVALGRGGRCGLAAILEGNNLPAVAITVLDTAQLADPDIAREVDIYYRTHPWTRPAFDRRGWTADVRAPLLELFYSPDCGECRELIDQRLGALARQGRIRLVVRDMNDSAQYQRLVELQQRAGTATREMPVAYFRRKFYDGRQAIEKALLPLIMPNEY